MKKFCKIKPLRWKIKNLFGIVLSLLKNSLIFRKNVFHFSNKNKIQNKYFNCEGHSELIQTKLKVKEVNETIPKNFKTNKKRKRCSSTIKTPKTDLNIKTPQNRSDKMKTE